MQMVECQICWHDFFGYEDIQFTRLLSTNVVFKNISFHLQDIVVWSIYVAFLHYIQEEIKHEIGRRGQGFW